jgi:sulfoquinovose isomerase
MDNTDDAAATRPRALAQWTAPEPEFPPAEWLDAEMRRLLTFAEGSWAPAGGFGNLDDDGRLDGSEPVHTWVSTRMTYCFALGALVGRDGDVERVDHGLAALLPGGLLRDDEHGGWFSAVQPDRFVVDRAKAAYAHAFVVLAASAASVLGRPAAPGLLQDALAVVEQRFWDEDAGLVRESFSADWSEEEQYRGANANMHTVEAFLAAADALGDAGSVWRDRAGRIVERIVNGVARDADWRLPEHFAPDYVPILDYNTDDRAHPFRPYGVTPGHLMEWARLALHLRAAELATGLSAPDWLLADARSLYDTAVHDGWAPDGTGGFVYTTDFDGTPITRARMHWVVTEALGAAAALYKVTREQRYADDHKRWWDFAVNHLIDRGRGSWYAELDDQLRPAHGTWQGKPDVYHALQATLIPRLPLAPMFAAGVRDAPTAYLGGSERA